MCRNLKRYNWILGRVECHFFRDINSVELPTNGNTFSDVEDANTRSIHLAATDSGLQILNEELEDDFTDSFCLSHQASRVHGG